MSTSEFSTEDFVLDPEFKKWVLENDPTAKEFWESYLAAHPKKAKEMEQARRILIGMARPKTNWSVEDEEFTWNKIETQIDQITDLGRPKKVVALDSWASIQHHKHQQSQKYHRSRLLKFAAFVLFFLGIGVLYFAQVSSGSSEKILASYDYVIREAPAGVKSTVSLPDGSKVILNSGSSIRYEKSLSGEIRLIELKGEAFFDVYRDVNKPFVVESNGIETRALGTSFNIRAYKDQPIFIALITGIVEVASESDSSLHERLAPGEGILADLVNQNWKKERFDPTEIIAWTNKTILFDEVAFFEAVKTLEQWYGVKISVTGKPPINLKVSGKFKEETLRNILEGLSYSSRFDYEISDKEVQIKF